MKIYVGGSFSARLRIRPQADKLWQLGHEVVGSWLDEVAKPESMTQDIFDKKLALKDMCEEASADLVIIDTIDRSSTGGSDAELGLALGEFQRKLVYVVGPQRSVFHRLADNVFKTWEECLRYMEENHAIYSARETSRYRPRNRKTR